MAEGVLVIDDDAATAGELVERYRSWGWDARRVDSLKAAEERLRSSTPDVTVVLAKRRVSDGDVLDLLEKLRRGGHAAEWILLTGCDQAEDARRALRLRVHNWMTAPIELDRLDVAVRSAVRARAALGGVRRTAERHSFQSWLGNSRSAAEVREMLVQLAPLPTTSIVLEGETGTGKGLAARILHYNGRRARAPMIELNCAAIPHDLLESELLGYEKGAFTGAQKRRRGVLELADQGTLFLDEIGAMDPRLQAKFLTALEEQRFRRLGGETVIEVDVQVIAASNRPLAELVRNDEFRADLYHRLQVVGLTLPPLRERREDLRVLVPEFIAYFNAKTGHQVTEVPERVWAALMSYDWPGNVRELRNVIERGVLLATGTEFPERWLHLPAATEPAEALGQGRISLALDGSMGLEDLERAILQQVLEETDYNVMAASRLLRTTRETLRYRMQKYGLRKSGSADAAD